MTPIKKDNLSRSTSKVVQKSLVHIESHFKVCETEGEKPNQTAGKVRYSRNYHFMPYFCTLLLPEVPFTRDVSFYNL